MLPISVFVNVIFNVRKSHHYACAKSTSVNIHISGIVPTKEG